MEVVRKLGVNKQTFCPWKKPVAVDGNSSGKSCPRTPTVSFVVQDVAAAEVSARLAKLAVFVSHGNFYAATVIDRLGFKNGGVVRAGCACYSTRQEVDRLIDGVSEIARRRNG